MTNSEKVDKIRCQRCKKEFEKGSSPNRRLCKGCHSNDMDDIIMRAAIGLCACS